MLGRYDDAHEAHFRAEMIACKRAVQLDPNDAQAHFNLGYAYNFYENDLEQAIENYEEAVRLDPNHVGAWIFLGQSYEVSGRYQQAINAYEKAVAIDPGDSYACMCLATGYLHLGLDHEKSGRYEDAIGAYQRAIQLDPKNKQGHYQLGRAYLQMGNKDLALVEQKILESLDKKLAAKSDLKNVDEMPIRQQQRNLLREQDERINSLQQWLQNEKQNIEKWFADTKQHIPEQKQNIENWYQDNLANLQKWKNAELERLDAYNREATARFVRNQNNTISYTDVKSVTNGYISPYGYLSSNTSSFGISRTSVRGDPAKQFSSETAFIANNRIAIVNTFENELRNLADQKARYLNSISEDSLLCEKTRALQEAERYVENASQAVASKKRNIMTATQDRLAGGPGVVIEAVFSSSGKESFDCSIDGRIYRQGDTVNGFKILKISAEEVIFEKDGRTWVHRLY
jgi:tetratricopeptide (TPR) repeat protein